MTSKLIRFIFNERRLVNREPSPSTYVRPVNSASRITRKFGSAYKLAAMLSAEAGRVIHVSTVRRWTYPQERGGTGGHIPYKFHELVWTAAKHNDITLHPEEFVNLEDDNPTIRLTTCSVTGLLGESK